MVERPPPTMIMAHIIVNKDSGRLWVRVPWWLIIFQGIQSMFRVKVPGYRHNFCFFVGLRHLNKSLVVHVEFEVSWSPVRETTILRT